MNKISHGKLTIFQKPKSKFYATAFMLAIIALPFNLFGADDFFSNVNQFQATPVDKKVVAAETMEIWNERIEIAPGESTAIPFKVVGEARITGVVKTLKGAPISGYIFTQDAYDEHFSNGDHSIDFKLLSFGGKRIARLNSVLKEESYVLVFLNQSKKPAIIQGKISTVTK